MEDKKLVCKTDYETAKAKGNLLKSKNLNTILNYL